MFSLSPKSVFICHILLLCLSSPRLLAQNASIPDSTRSAANDSTRLDSTNSLAPSFLETRPDSIPPQRDTIKPVSVGIDSSVTYSARTIISQQDEQITYLIGDATVKFKNMTIKAGKITVRWKDNTLTAEKLPDSTNHRVDSLAVAKKTLPVFSDGKETMVGEEMEFNFKTEKGRILRGRTEFDKGFYAGDAVKRVQPQVFNVANGKYTTCNLEEPHYHFEGKKMKVIVNDKVVAKPVIFFIGKIPVAIAPFAMFPAQENGRQSGIIIPHFGSSPVEGRYLRNLGYYWATNDYFDARFTLDFFERTGILFRTNMNYALRYNFNGSVAGSFTRKNFETRRERRWDFSIRHNQEIDETSRLNVDASFVSNNTFYKEFSNNLEQRLNRQLRSNATYSKSWGQGKNSLSINLSQTKDLETGSNFVTLPQIRFSRNQSALFPFDEDKTGRSKEEPNWYNFIRYSYNSFLVNTVREDSTNDPDAQVDRRVEHDLNFSFTSPKKIFGWLTWNQTFNYNEDWFDRKKDFTLNRETNRFETTDNKGFASRRTFQYSTSASTNLFGTFYPKIGPIRALRHKMTPSLSYSYRPDFSNSFWGYFQSGVDTSGKEIRLDRFSGTPSGELSSLGFGLTNLFQMKLADGDKEKKVDLFNLDFRSGFNFAADSLKWQSLTTSFRANPKKNLTISMNMAHSFYDFDPQTGRTVDRLLWNKSGVLNFLRLTRFQIDARWQLSGSKKTQAQAGKQPFQTYSQSAGELEFTQATEEDKLEDNDRFAPENPFSAFEIPWRATFAVSYSENKFNPLNPSRSAYIDLSNVEVQLTQKWRIGYRLRYDLERKNIVDQRISFYRDLHCWEARFDWNPSGIGQGYYFIIKIKAPHLNDIKFEHRGGTSSVFTPF